MSLIRQVWLLLLGVVLLATAGGMVVTLLSSRDTLQTQLQLKNNDNAQSLALLLSQQHSHPQTMALLLAAQFDTGFYRRIRHTPADGGLAFERTGSMALAAAPAWFARLLPIEAAPGVAQVSDGWRPLGSVEVQSESAYAHDELWRAALRTVAWMLAVGLVAALFGAAMVRRLQRLLQATVEQAHALVNGRYVIVDEPRVPELRHVAQAMNAMVQRVRSLFEAQAAQLESLRRQAYCDALTGLAHRAHFNGRLLASLQQEDGGDSPDGGALLLVRLHDLPGRNRELGRDTVDHALRLIADALRAACTPWPQGLAGRLNGADFALYLPGAGPDAAPAAGLRAAETVVDKLNARLQGLNPSLHVHVGAVSFTHGVKAGDLMAQADAALARAELRGAWAIEVASATSAAVQGEAGWRAQVIAALEDGRAELAEFAVLDARGALAHLECPLRLQLEIGGRCEPASRWLPLARRNGLTVGTDIRALSLAMDAIERDGRPRAVNVSPASLADGGFATHLQNRLRDRPQAARHVLLDVPESAVAQHFDTLQELARLLRPLGVRIGLEHAGQGLHCIDRLYELGLDYVKLDGSLCSGVATSPAAQDFLRSTVALLHALSVQAMAEGVSDKADADVLWRCGIDAITGPWAGGRLARVSVPPVGVVVG